MLHDSPDARLVVFRLAPGEQVDPHRSTSAVQLCVLHGTGFVTGEGSEGEREVACNEGDIVLYAPNELHGMRAGGDELMLLATITPRPGGAH
jgi:quercetin dioxygenase-like cupin family protein